MQMSAAHSLGRKMEERWYTRRQLLRRQQVLGIRHVMGAGRRTYVGIRIRSATKVEARYRFWVKVRVLTGDAELAVAGDAAQAAVAPQAGDAALAGAAAGAAAGPRARRRPVVHHLQLSSARRLSGDSTEGVYGLSRARVCVLSTHCNGGAWSSLSAPAPHQCWRFGRAEAQQEPSCHPAQ